MGADLHGPEGAATAVATVLHPHPGMGGDRHHPLVVAVAEGLAAAGVGALRLDLPDPDVDAAVPRLERAAVDLRAQLGVDAVHLVGYSWGAAVSARARPDGLTARVLVAPPVGMLPLPADDGVPTLVLVPAHDQFAPPDAVAAAVDGRRSTSMEVVDGCDHFLVGAVARIADRAVGWLVG